jgi:hypothetical protein
MNHRISRFIFFILNDPITILEVDMTLGNQSSFQSSYLSTNTFGRERTIPPLTGFAVSAFSSTEMAI